MPQTDDAASDRPVRQVIVYASALVGGAGLFFLSFAAIFTGAWPLLLLFLLGYAAAGALGVRIGRATPALMACLLIIPALPWVAWLFPASIPEAGLARAALWVALVVLMGGLAWTGGWLAVKAAGRMHLP
jgi:hypothetical protein